MEDKVYMTSRSGDHRRSKSIDHPTPLPQREVRENSKEVRERMKGRFPFLVLVSEQFLPLYHDVFCNQVAEDTG
jgi:hypothetical protein